MYELEWHLHSLPVGFKLVPKHCIRVGFLDAFGQTLLIDCPFVCALSLSLSDPYVMDNSLTSARASQGSHERGIVKD